MRGITKTQSVFEPSEMLFEDSIRELEYNLPILTDYASNSQTLQKFTDDTLGVRTVLYEDSHGNCWAIVDEED